MTIPLLHRVLGIGLTVLAATFLGLKSFGVGPSLVHDDLAPVMAYALSGLAAVLIFTAFVVVKPRVPERSAGRSVDQYWSTPEVAAKVLPVWFLLEGAGVLAAVGFLLTGALVSAIAAAIAVLAFWMCGPNVFARP